MKCTNFKRVRWVVFGLVYSILLCPSWIEANLRKGIGDTDEAISAAEAAEIAISFIGSEKVQKEKYEITLNEVLDNTNKPTSRKVVLGPAMIIVNGEKKQVVAWNFRDWGFARKSDQDETVTPELFRKEYVLFDKDEATAAAQRFLKSRFGPHVFDDAIQLEVGERPSAPGFLYVLEWRKKANPDGVFYGRTWIQVLVSPVDGAVKGGIVDLNKVSQLPKMEVGEVRKRAHQTLLSEGYVDCATEKEIRLLSNENRGEAGILIWCLYFNLPPNCGSSEAKHAGNLLVLEVQDGTGLVKILRSGN